MRELTTREKIGIVVVIIAAVVALYFMGILTPSRFGLTGGDLSAKETELKTTENLIKFDKLVSEIEDEISAEAGLQCNLISESLFKEISEKLTVEKLNQAKTPKELYEIVPALKNKASQVLAYRKEIGEFEKVEQLKEIKCSIFEGEPAQAVISRQISGLTKKAGLKPGYQLSVKPLPGKKQERISIQNRQKLVEKLYQHELKKELNNLVEQVKKAEETSSEEKSSEEISEKEQIEQEGKEAKGQKGKGAKGQSIDAVDAPQDVNPQTDEIQEDVEGDDESNRQEGKEQEEVQLTDKETKEKEKQKFPSLSEKIPIKVRVEIAKTILSSNYPIKKQIKSNARLKQILDDFQIEEQEKPVNIKSLISIYVEQVDKTQRELLEWLKDAPISYTKQAYIVEMLSVKGKLEQLVKLIHLIESSSRFLKIRDFQVTVANKKETMLNANIEIIATVL